MASSEEIYQVLKDTGITWDDLVQAGYKPPGHCPQCHGEGVLHGCRCHGECEARNDHFTKTCTYCNGIGCLGNLKERLSGSKIRIRIKTCLESEQ